MIAHIHQPMARLPDLMIEDHGIYFLFWPESERAIAWCDRYIEKRQYFETYAAYVPMAWDIVAKAQADGLILE